MKTMRWAGRSEALILALALSGALAALSVHVALGRHPPAERFLMWSIAAGLLVTSAAGLALLARLRQREAAVNAELEEAVRERTTTLASEVATRRIVEAELRGARDRLRLALEAADTSCWDLDVARQQVVLDERWSVICGGPPHQTRVGLRTLWSLVHPAERRMVLERVVSCFAPHQDDYEVEHRVKHRDGGWVWILSRGRTMARDERGHALRIIGTNTDITRRKHAEQALERERDFLAALSETTVDLLGRRREEELLQGIVDRASRLLQVEQVELALLAGRELTVRAASGVALSPTPLSREEAPVCWSAIDTGAPALADTCARHGLPVAAFPILQGERCLGVLALRRSSGAFTAPEVGHATALSRLAALVLHKTAIYHDALRTAEARTVELRESEERFRVLFDDSPVPIALATFPEGEVRAVNAAVTTISGFAAEQLIGQHTLDLPFWCDREDRGRIVGLLHRDGAVRNYEARVRIAGGRVATALFSCSIVLIAGRRYSLNTLLDISDRKQAEERLAATLAALRENEARFRAVFHQSPIPILLTTVPEARIMEANAASLATFGYARDEIIGRSTDELGVWADPRQRAEYFRQLQDSGMVHGIEAQMRTQSGAVLDMFCTGTLVTIDGQPWVLSSAIDVTARKQAEAARAELEQSLRQSQKMESLGTLAGGIAHDFNNVLTGIFGFTDLARQELPPQHTARGWLDQATSTCQRAKELVRQILTFSRRTENERRAQRLQPVVEEALHLLRSTLPAMVELSPTVSPLAPPANVDATQVHQIVLNLCTNAWHALPETGGRIEVKLEPCTVTARQTLAQGELVPGAFVRLTIADNGCGMTPAVAERIFEPFFTTKEAGKGSGLGLAVVHGIMHAHGGAIGLKTAIGVGTTFSLYFPALVAVETPRRAPISTFSRGAGELIFLADDDPDSGLALEKLTEALGYRVRRFDRAAALLETFRAAPQACDAVITDLAMPGMTGDLLAHELLRLRPGVPVLVVTGLIDAAHERALVDTGVFSVMRKPLEWQDLARQLAAMLADRPKSPPAAPVAAAR